MTNRSFLTWATAIGMAASTSAWAQAAAPEQSYVGAVFWSATQASQACKSLGTLPSGVIYPVSSVAASSTSSSCSNELNHLIKVYAGNRLQGNWHIEGALMSFGKASLRNQQVGDHDEDADTADVVTDRLDASVSAQAGAVSIAYKHRFDQFDQRLTGVARAGLAVVQTSFKSVSSTISSSADPTLVAATRADDSEVQFRPIFGLGAEYQFNDTLSAVVSADFTSAKVNGKTINLSAFGVGLQMGFNP